MARRVSDIYNKGYAMNHGNYLLQVNDFPLMSHDRALNVEKIMSIHFLWKK